MANLIYQGKINRQFWGKIMKKLCSQYVTPGGCLNYQNGSLITFFHNVRRIE